MATKHATDESTLRAASVGSNQYTDRKAISGTEEVTNSRDIINYKTGYKQVSHNT